VHDYRVRFSALATGEIGPSADARLAAALATMPGAERVEGAEEDPARGRVSAGFWIKVRLGMADAARDGSRLAKEALKVAGLGEAQLVELAVSLVAADEDGGHG
jgi:hypothetical protein